MVISRKTKSAAANSIKLTKTRSIKSYFSAPAPEQSNRTESQTPSSSLQDKTEQRAYDLYVRKGRKDGFDQFDWNLAETFVKLENAASRTRTSTNRIAAGQKVLEEDIQKKAYELYEKRGYAHGDDQFDWNLARELVYLQNRVNS